MKKEKLKYKKRKKRTPFQSILIDYDVATACDEAMERFTNSFAFSNFGLALQWFVWKKSFSFWNSFFNSWNVKTVVGNILYVGSDGLSVLFQWQPEQPKKLFITLSGTGRVKAVLEVINAEMEKLKAVKKIETPPIKRGMELNPYVQMAAGQIVEYDFKKVLESKVKLLFPFKISGFISRKDTIPRHQNHANRSIW